MDEVDAADLSLRLIGGLDVETFNREVRERQFRKFESAFEWESVGRLFDLAKLEALLAKDIVPATFVDVVLGGLPKRLADLQKGTGKSSLEIAAENFRRGGTIRVSDVQRFVPRLDRFAREIGRRFAARSQINVYLTPPGKTGFEPHFDTTDIFIVQCFGTKDWRIFRDYTDKIELPLLETPWDPQRYCPSSEFEALALRAGDVLYLPRGVMHQAHCTDQASMHMTISVAPLTISDVMVREIRRLAESNIELRRRVKWSVDDSTGDLSLLDVEVRKRFGELIQQIDMNALLTKEAKALQEPRSSVEGAGGLQSAIAELTSEKDP